MLQLAFEVHSVVCNGGVLDTLHRVASKALLRQ